MPPHHLMGAASDCLTHEARRENAIALATALGMKVDDAARALNLSILITADAGNVVAMRIAHEVSSLLSRTVKHVSFEYTGSLPSAELIIGATSPRTDAVRIFASVTRERAVLVRLAGNDEPPPLERCDDLPPLICLLIACYASAATLHHALQGVLPFGMPNPLSVEFSQLGIDLTAFSQPIALGRAYLAGAGAIGNGFLWAARHLDVRGQLDIVDDDDVCSGNLNRQIWFDTADIGEPKAGRLVARAELHFPRLRLTPRRSRLQNLPERSGRWLEKLLVAVDSRRARRALQNEFPGDVFDASTTDIREIVVHHNRQPNEAACLSCIYETDAEEMSREQHIADHLGVSVAAVRSERICAASARLIAVKFVHLRAEALEGTAYDTLFKALCAEGALKTPSGKRVAAPFAFVSVLAGVYLAIELARSLTIGRSTNPDNYWRLSPWHPPLLRRRSLRPRQPGCAFCGNNTLQSVNAALWPSVRELGI